MSPTPSNLPSGHKTLFFIGGLGDIDIATNQSLKNTIKYLSEFGYQVHYFGALPARYRILQNPQKVFNDRVIFHRSPDFLAPLFDFVKFLKDTFGMSRKKNQKSKCLRPAQKIRYYDENNFFGRLLYMGFFFVYVPIEVLRISYYYFKFKPDLFYGINGQGSALATPLGKLYRKPVIQRWHGCSYTEEDVKKIQTRLRDKFLELDGSFAKWLPSDAVVVTNDGSRGDKIFPLFGVPPERIYFWMNGIDLEDMTLPADWDAESFKVSLGLQGKKILLMVTRLVLWKRVDRVIDCVHRLVKQHKMENFVALILGEGPETPILKAMAEDFGISRYVRFLGAVPHREVAKYFSIADVFLSLCDMMNLVNPLLEAMYAGLPIITIDDDSTSELLKNGENAFLIPHAQLEDDLPLKVKMLLTDEFLRRRIGRNAKNIFHEKILSWRDRMLLEHELIQKLLANEIYQDSRNCGKLVMPLNK